MGFDRETYYDVIEEELEKLNSMAYAARKGKEALLTHNFTGEELRKATARLAALDDLIDAMSGARNPEWQYSRKQEEKKAGRA